jgi:Asp-tRNA(Asn)/Glu-tRNA(Gln) amidotransferase A subunit family amidase
MKPLHDMTATELVGALESGATNALAIAESCLEQIKAREPAVLAWHYLDPEQALQNARQIDADSTAQPASASLRGVPIGFKDIIDTADMPTEYGTPIHRGHQPHLDAACVALSRRAKANVFGKTVTTEFANRSPGKTTNPFDPTRTPGGSSSGSAAAVAAHMVPLAIGTQTTASTIRPASYCGVVGYRPTWGDLRCHGVMEASGSLDTLGLFARSVDDIALFRDVLAATAPAPLPVRELTGLRIGLAAMPMWQECETTTQAMLQECAERLAKAGARVTELALPSRFELLDDAHRWISSFEFARARTWEIDHHWSQISEFLREHRLKDGMACSFETYTAAKALAERCWIELDQIFADYDLLLVPAAAGEAPVGLQSTGNAAFCTVWSAVHVPAVTLPLYTGPNNLPVGIQFIAARGNDRAMLAAANAIMRLYS